MKPAKIVAEKRPGNTVVGWKLDCDHRAQLLERIQPRYGKVIADHVTLAARVAADTPLPEIMTAVVIGRADDGQGVEALVVEIDGESDRPDGSTYHIIWSLEPERKPVESNDVIAEHGWTALDEPLPISLTPARFP